MSKDRLNRLKTNLDRIRDRIARSCERVGRDPSEVTLVAVTKMVTPDVAGLLFEAGVEHIGENRVAEAQRKIEVLGDKGTWHMIGHLQRNKVKKAIPLFSMIHSVDSLRLLREIALFCEKRETLMEILFEVNVSGEASKYGLEPSELDNILNEAGRLPSVKVRGLMTMAPFDPDPEAARPHFRALRTLWEQTRNPSTRPDYQLLSMGMSGDFETAVEEGATHIRVGTALYEGL
jgi:pyridoxal phosphate enzyme (YggS family)